MTCSALSALTNLLEEGCMSSLAVEKITKSLIERSSEELCQYIGRLDPELDQCNKLLNAVQYVVRHNTASFSHLQDVGLLSLLSAVLQKTLARLSRDGHSSNMQNNIEIEIETVNVIAEADPSAKSQIFLALCPYLMDFLLHGLLGFQTKMEVLKSINMLLEQCRTSFKEKLMQDEHVCQKITNLVNLMKTVGDYEFQVCQLECLMRLFPRKSREVYASKMFTDKQMLQEFLDIRDQEFEVDCRSFLNSVNGRTENPAKGVFSIPCEAALLGRKQLRKPSDEGYEEFWVDFNTGSERLTLFCEQDSLLSQSSLLDEGEWETVAVYKTDILKYECIGDDKKFLLKIWLKSPVCQIYPSQHQDVTDNTISVLFLPHYENHVIAAADLIFDFSGKKNKVSTVEKPLHISLRDVQEADSQSQPGVCVPPVLQSEPVHAGSQESVTKRKKVSVPCVPMKNPASTPILKPAIPKVKEKKEHAEEQLKEKDFVVPSTPPQKKNVLAKNKVKVKTPVVTVSVPVKSSEKISKKKEKKCDIDSVSEENKNKACNSNIPGEEMVIPESQPPAGQSGCSEEIHSDNLTKRNSPDKDTKLRHSKGRKQKANDLQEPASVNISKTTDNTNKTYDFELHENSQLPEQNLPKHVEDIRSIPDSDNNADDAYEVQSTVNRQKSSKETKSRNSKGKKQKADDLQGPVSVNASKRTDNKIKTYQFDSHEGKKIPEQNLPKHAEDINSIPDSYDNTCGAVDTIESVHKSIKDTKLRHSKRKKQKAEEIHEPASVSIGKTRDNKNKTYDLDFHEDGQLPEQNLSPNVEGIKSISESYEKVDEVESTEKASKYTKAAKSRSRKGKKQKADDTKESISLNISKTTDNKNKTYDFDFHKDIQLPELNLPPNVEDINSIPDSFDNAADEIEAMQSEVTAVDLTKNVAAPKQNSPEHDGSVKSGIKRTTRNTCKAPNESERENHSKGQGKNELSKEYKEVVNVKKSFIDVNDSLKELCDSDKSLRDSKTNAIENNHKKSLCGKNMKSGKCGLIEKEDVNEDQLWYHAELMDLDKIPRSRCVKLTRDQRKAKPKKCKMPKKNQTRKDDSLQFESMNGRQLRKRENNPSKENEKFEPGDEFDEVEKVSNEEDTDKVTKETNKKKEKYASKENNDENKIKKKELSNVDNASRKQNAIQTTPQKETELNFLDNDELDPLVIVSDDEDNIRRYKLENSLTEKKKPEDKTKKAYHCTDKDKTLSSKHDITRRHHAKHISKNVESKKNHKENVVSPNIVSAESSDKFGNSSLETSATECETKKERFSPVLQDCFSSRFPSKTNNGKQPLVKKEHDDVSFHGDNSFLGRVERMKHGKQMLNMSQSMSRQQSGSMVFEWSYSRSRSKISKRNWSYQEAAVKTEQEDHDPYDFASQDIQESQDVHMKQGKSKKNKTSKVKSHDHSKSRERIKTNDKSKVMSKIPSKRDSDKMSSILPVEMYHISPEPMCNGNHKKKKHRTTLCQDKTTKKWFRKSIEDIKSSKDDSGFDVTDEMTTFQECPLEPSSESMEDSSQDKFTFSLEDLTPQHNKGKQTKKERKNINVKGQKKKMTFNFMSELEQTPCSVSSLSSTPRHGSKLKRAYSPLDISIIKTPQSCERFRFDLSDEVDKSRDISRRHKRKQHSKKVQYKDLSDSGCEEDSSFLSTKQDYETSLLDSSRDISTKSEKSWIQERIRKSGKKKTPKTYKPNKLKQEACIASQTDDSQDESSQEGLIMDTEKFFKSVFTTNLEVVNEPKAMVDPDVMILTPYTPKKPSSARSREDDIEVFQTQENLTVSLNVSCDDNDEIKSLTFSGLGLRTPTKFIQDEDDSQKDQSPYNKTKFLDQGIKPLLGDSGFASGPSSEVRPTMSSLKRKYSDIPIYESQESEGEKEEEEGVVVQDLDHSTLVPKKLFKFDPAACLSTISSPVGTSVISDGTDLDLYNPASDSNIDPVLATFGPAVLKHVKERQQVIEHHLKLTHKEAQKHFNNSWIEQQQIQSNITDEYHAKMTNELIALEKDIAQLRAAERQTEELYTAQMELLRKNQESQKMRLANMKSIEYQHCKKCKKMKDHNKRIQEKVTEKLKGEMSALQRKLIQDAQKHEYLNMKKRLQKMF